MDELISKQALKADLLKRGFFPVIVKRALQEAPSVDAVEVIRCKDCKQYRKNTCIRRDWAYTEPNDFCSDGERKNK